jgi:hypothetical protein
VLNTPSPLSPKRFFDSLRENRVQNIIAIGKKDVFFGMERAQKARMNGNLRSYAPGRGFML